MRSSQIHQQAAATDTKKLDQELVELRTAAAINGDGRKATIWQQSKHVVHNKKECEARRLQPPLSVRLRQTRPMSDAAALTTEASI